MARAPRISNQQREVQAPDAHLLDPVFPLRLPHPGHPDRFQPPGRPGLTKLGKCPGYRRERNLDEIELFLREHECRHCILVLDEAQNDSLEAPEELRLLLGLNPPTQPAFALVLPPSVTPQRPSRGQSISNDPLLGIGFQLLEQVNEAHLTPWNTEQRFSYFRFAWQRSDSK